MLMGDGILRLRITGDGEKTIAGLSLGDCTTPDLLGDCIAGLSLGDCIAGLSRGDCTTPGLLGDCTTPGLLGDSSDASSAVRSPTDISAYDRHAQ
jgi:hypothetical protein